ncbi:MAG: hypothetical protein J3R72DRAFT_488005 [Linnemannia gamsii]|nr:MAG: hypothetical protein J3R72DRAFT_488005 [Linnemannia gamsii]
MGGDTDGDCGPQKPMVELQWYHVAIASVLILINGALSIALGLGLEKRLFISALRCVVQLTIMGTVLQTIFDAKNPVFVMLMALLLITLGTNEAVFNVSKRRHIYMFPSVLVSMGCSCLIIGTFGTRLAMGVDPLHSPKEFIPALGMLLGNTMTAISLGLDQCLSQLSENKERIELYLSMGATRWEACRPIAIEAMRRAMLPTINQMSIIGLISIPGMMTGQLIAGASVMNAVKSQIIIMYLISGAAAFGTLSSVMICLRVCFDSSDRLRPERIIKTQSIIPKPIREFGQRASNAVGNALCCCRKAPKSPVPSPSRTPPSSSPPRSQTQSPTREQNGSRQTNGQGQGQGKSKSKGEQNGAEQQKHQQEQEATERTPLVRSR